MRSLNNWEEETLAKIEVGVCNWDKFNGRKDVKEPHWFRLNNNFLENPDFFGFTAEEKLVWIYLLSLASRKQSGSVTVNLVHAERVCDLPQESFLSGLEKLKEINCVSVDVTWTSRGRYVDVTPQTNKQTIQTNKQYSKTLPDEVRDQGGEHANDGVPGKIKKPKESPDSLRSRENIRACWIENYKARYGFEPTDTTSVFYRTQLKRVHATLGEEKALRAIHAYLNWDDPFVAKQAHPISLLLKSLDALRADYVNPKAKYNAIARGRAQEKVMTESEQRLEEMKAYATKQPNGSSLLAAGGRNEILDDSSGGESGSRVIPCGTQDRILKQRVAVHGGNAEANAAPSGDVFENGG